MKLTRYNAIRVLLGLVSIVTFFHLLLLIKLIPYTIAWGGRLQSDEQMYMFETASIAINLFLIFTLLMKGGYIKARLKEKIVNTVLWIFLILFVLNTIANLFAQTNFEKLFALLTLTFAMLLWMILRKK
jgi:hypothetical protein